VTQWTPLPHQFHALAAASPGAVLLQTARFDHTNRHSYLFLQPLKIISVTRLEELPELFQQIEGALADGCYLAGFFGYECGYHFESFPCIPIQSSDLPLAWLGVYRDPIVFDHQQDCILNDVVLPDSGDVGHVVPDALADTVSLQLSQEDYVSKVRRIKDYIAAGDTYQVNFTNRVEISVANKSIEAFQSLLRHQPVAYSAFLNLRDCQILSLSPELFFRIDQGKITTRPMKGTMPRGLDLEGDRRAALRLHDDEKNRSEHVMIVDLLRNDLGRICTMGSVQVDDLFTIEKYQTLLQMTSTVSGTLRQGLRYYDIFRSLFPSGSITGAPKVRTMQIIHELELSSRGVYMGAIGYFAPGGSAAFNVAIRTLVVREGKATMGVGGGIVADSEPAAEYRECLLKASFLTRRHRDFQLIETMLWNHGLVRLDLHLQRLEDSAAYFGFFCDRSAIAAKLQQACADLPQNISHRIRLLLDASGEVSITPAKIDLDPSLLRVRLAAQPVSSSNYFLRHKTTHRRFYEDQLAAARREGFDEVLFVNERGELTEGAISNLFLRINGHLVTPPLACGVLPGIFRRHLLDTEPTAEERILTMSDLRAADAVYLCNSLRGLRQVETLLPESSPSVGLI
jgi:para-aminobenzoate synthetase / 4-amino-4-deoxychorismate lyase